MDKLRALRFFISSCDHGNFIGVAKQFGTSASTVSKAISRLENQIGLQLFQRSTRQLRLTPAGAEYLVTVKTITDELEQCEVQLSQQNNDASGQLRINVPISYGRLYILQLLKKFNQRYPDINIEIQFDDSYVDIIEQGFDIAIRSGSINDSQLVVQKLSPIDMIICASKAYLKAHGRPGSSQDFAQHQWIAFRYKQTGKLHPILMPGKKQEERFVPEKGIVVGDGEALAQLCADGLGLTQIPHFIAKKWLESGAIEPVLPTYTPPHLGVYILYPRRVHMPARARVFIEFVKESIQASGETPRHTWARDLPINRAK